MNLVNNFINFSSLSSKIELNKKAKPVTVKFMGLSKDIVSFKSKEKSGPDPYKKIDKIALEYFDKLKISIDSGLSFLKSQVDNLKVKFNRFDSSIAGLASIKPDDKFKSGYSYEILLNKSSDEVFMSALHEGYHILQFDNNPDEEFIMVHKMLASSLKVNPELKQQYKDLLDIVINHIFIPRYNKLKNTYRNEIVSAIRKQDLDKMANYKANKLFDESNNLFNKDLVNWFESLPEDRMLKYVLSHVKLEIKTHTFCMNLDKKPLLDDKSNINFNKLRDLLAIKLYKELESMAENELNKRVSCEKKLNIA